MTSKEKLDSLLGISDSSDNKSMDDFLNELNIDDGTAEYALSAVDSSLKDQFSKIDDSFNMISSNASSSDLTDIKNNLGNISELINVSKSIIKHLYDNIINTDLIDTELVNAAASFIEVAHRNTKEYIDLYKDRLRFFDKVQLENLKFQNQKELLDYKHKLEMEKINSKAVDVTPEGSVQWNQERIIEILDETKNNSSN